MAPFERRLVGARKVAHHPRILVSDLERRLGTVRTHATLARIHRRLPGTRFVWLMGADLPALVHTWQHWVRIFETVGVAVLARPAYPRPALTSTAFRRFQRARLRGGRGRALASQRPPAWTFLRGPLHPASATAVREEQRLAGASPSKTS